MVHIFLGLPVHAKNLEDNTEKSEPLALFSYMNELGWVVYHRPSSLKPCCWLSPTMEGWLIVYCMWLYSVQEYFTQNKDITIAGEGLQNLGFFSTLTVYEQGGIFIVPYLVLSWYHTSVYTVSSEDCHVGGTEFSAP